MQERRVSLTARQGQIQGLDVNFLAGASTASWALPLKRPHLSAYTSRTSGCGLGLLIQGATRLHTSRPTDCRAGGAKSEVDGMSAVVCYSHRLGESQLSTAIAIAKWIKRLDSLVKELSAILVLNQAVESVASPIALFLMCRRSVPDVPTLTFLKCRRSVPDVPKDGPGVDRAMEEAASGGFRSRSDLENQWDSAHQERAGVPCYRLWKRRTKS